MKRVPRRCHSALGPIAHMPPAESAVTFHTDLTPPTLTGRRAMSTVQSGNAPPARTSGTTTCVNQIVPSESEARLVTGPDVALISLSGIRTAAGRRSLCSAPSSASQTSPCTSSSTVVIGPNRSSPCTTASCDLSFQMLAQMLPWLSTYRLLDVLEKATGSFPCPFQRRSGDRASVMNRNSPSGD